MKKLFDDLLESAQQIDKIHRGERGSSRRFVVDNVAADSKHAGIPEGVVDASSTPPKGRNNKAL